MQDYLRVPHERFSFDKAAVWALSLAALAAIVLLIPLESVSLYATKVTVFAVGVLVALIAFVIARLLSGSVQVPPLALVGSLWLVPLAYALSALFSGSGIAYSFFGTEFETDTLGFMLLLALSATLAAFAFKKPSACRVFYGLIGAALGILLLGQALIILAARLGAPISPTLTLIGSFSEFGMAAGFAAFLALVSLRFLNRSGRKRAALFALLVLALFALALVNASLVWGIIALASLGLCIEAVLRRREDVQGQAHGDEASARARMLLAPLGTLLVSLFFLMGGSSIGDLLSGALGVSSLDVRPSWQSTFSIGSHTYASSPLFGSGPGTFGEQWLQFRDRSLNDTIFWSVDFSSGIGLIPTSFVTTGIVGVIAWLAFIGFFAFAGIRALLFRLPEDPMLRFSALASGGGAAYVLALAFLAVPGPAMLALGFLSLGVFISVLRFGSEERVVVFAKAPRVGFAVVFLLTLLLIGSVGALYMTIERYLGTLAYGEAATALAGGDIDRAETALVRSLSLAPTERAYRLAAAANVERMRRIAADETLSPTAAQEQFQNALTASITVATEAVRLGPDDYENWVVLGGVYQSVTGLGIEGAYEGAKRSYERAAALNPTTPVLPYMLAQLEIAEGNTEAAEAHLLAAMNQKRDYIPAILLLSQLEIQLGRAAQALQAAEAAAYFAPNEPAVLFQVGLLRSGTGDTAGAIAALSRAIELNPQYANARFFLGALYATEGRYAEALAELRFIASLSEENAVAVAEDIAALEAGTNPFPLSRLRTLGIPTPPVSEPEPSAAES